jgi:type IV pilus assembly protein PilW
MRSFSAKGSRFGSALGFTLVEVLVVVALTGVVAAAVYKALAAQQKVYSVQDQAVDMQETVRAAMDIMAKDIRMAGCDPRGAGNAGFLTAAVHTMRVGMDIPADFDESTRLPIEQRCDGNITSAGEDITYSFTPSGGVGSIIRADAVTGHDSIADNIEALEFRYILADRSFCASPCTTLDQIRKVEITMLVRNSTIDTNFTNKLSYQFPSNNTYGPFNNGYRRRMQTTWVMARNMGY